MSDKRRPVSAAQVERMVEVIEETLAEINARSPEYIRHALKQALLHEIMYAAGLRFEDEAARLAGTPVATRAEGILGEVPRD